MSVTTLLGYRGDIEETSMFQLHYGPLLKMKVDDSIFSPVYVRFGYSHEPLDKM